MDEEKRDPSMLLRRRGTRGFTVLEILIAIVILVLGISGIIALFPTAIESGNQTVQDSYAAAITQSVIDALAVGIRESRYRVPDSDSPPRVWTYFIFDHDGVYNRMVPSPQNYATDPQIAEADWCILLPMGRDPNTDPTQEPWFLYPSHPNKPVEIGSGAPQSLPGPYDVRTAASLAGLANPTVSDDMRLEFFKEANDGQPHLWVRRVFMLGRYREGQNPTGFPARSIREEFLGEPEGGATTANAAANRPVVDPYPQYSFAVAIRRAKIDNVGLTPTDPPDGKIGQFDRYTSSLYEVHVLVFRNFDGSSGTHQGIASGSMKIPRTNVPLKEFVTLMSL